MSPNTIENSFDKASLDSLLDAYTGLFILLSSQFKYESFMPGNTSMIMEGNSFYNGHFGIGGFLMIGFPNNWDEDEIYEFNWAKLKKDVQRFNRIDYNNM